MNNKFKAYDKLSSKYIDSKKVAIRGDGKLLYYLGGGMWSSIEDDKFVDLEIDVEWEDD